jgi:hypothetical protein
MSTAAAPPPVVESVIESVIEDILIKDAESTHRVRRNVKVTKTHKKTNNSRIVRTTCVRMDIPPSAASVTIQMKTTSVTIINK